MYRFLADNAMDLITRHSSDGRIRFASPAAQTILDQSPQDLVGVAPSALVHPDALRAMQAAFMESAYFARAASAEVRMRRREGSYVWAEIRCRPAAPVHNEATDIVAVTRDISERKAQERALIEARDQAETAQPRQDELPGQYESRAAHAVERDHRFLRSDDSRDVRPRRQPEIS